MDIVAPFGLKYPIFQAPTGSIAGPDLAAAVAEAGGMGAMGLNRADPEVAAAKVRQVRASTKGLFQVNFVISFPPFALAEALDAGAPFVTFSWGDPSPYVSVVRAAGARFGVQVSNADGAKQALDLGADFLVCQGMEAGGHVQSTTALGRLLPAVVELAGIVPVVAAGGIANGRAIRRVLEMGAAGAMLGTRFVATVESLAHEEYKRALVLASGTDTALTVCFDGGWPYAAHRVLRNGTFEDWEAAGSPPSGSRPGEGDVVAMQAGGEPILRYADLAPRVGMSGRIDEMCLYAGIGVGAIRDVPTAGEVVRRLWAETVSG